MNKVVIEVYVPLIEEKYDIFIPICKNINSIINLIIKAINEISEDSIPDSTNFELYNKVTGIRYNRNQIVKNTDIRNDSKLVLI